MASPTADIRQSCRKRASGLVGLIPFVGSDRFEIAASADQSFQALHHRDLYLIRMRGSSATNGLAPTVAPHELLDGPVTVLAPHMDDEVIGCGATLAAVSSDWPVHVVYLTDGAGSPAPAAPWIGSRPSRLPETRAAEARLAMRELGVPTDNLRFLGFHDGTLARREDELRDRVLGFVRELRPRYLLVPFRYDRHPDHLTANRAALRAVGEAFGDEARAPRIVEYFVYYRSLLLPKGDVRRYVRADQLARVDSAPFSDTKRRALACYKSQTTIFYGWQVRPNLTPRFVDEVCTPPEAFVVYSPYSAGSRILRRGARWVRAVQAIEQPLKRVKDRGLTLMRLPHAGRPT